MENHKIIFLDLWKRMKAGIIVAGFLLGISTYFGILEAIPVMSNFSIGFSLFVFAAYTFSIWKTLKNATIINKYSLAKNTGEVVQNATLGNVSTNTYFTLGMLYFASVVLNRLEFANLTRLTYIIGDYFYLGAILYFVQASNYLNKYILLAIEGSVKDIKDKLFQGGKDDKDE